MKKQANETSEQFHKRISDAIMNELLEYVNSPNEKIKKQSKKKKTKTKK